MSVGSINAAMIPKYAKDAPSISACGRFSKIFLNVMSKAWKIAKVAIPIVLVIGLIIVGIEIFHKRREYTALETIKSIGFNLAFHVGYKKGMKSIAERMNANGIAKEFDSAAMDVYFSNNYEKMDCLFPFLNLDQAKRAISATAGSGNLNYLQRIFDTYEIDINSFNEEISPLRRAATRGHLDIVNYLLRNGINQTHDRNLSLGEAIANKHVDIVTVLVDHDDTINREDVDFGYIENCKIESKECLAYRAFKGLYLERGRNMRDYFLQFDQHDRMLLG